MGDVVKFEKKKKYENEQVEEKSNFWDRISSDNKQNEERISEERMRNNKKILERYKIKKK